MLCFFQMAKIGRALVDGATGSEAAEGGAAEAGEPLAVKPQFFKALVGKGHPEFSSPRQQVRVCRGGAHGLES